MEKTFVFTEAGKRKRGLLLSEEEGLSCRQEAKFCFRMTE